MESEWKCDSLLFDEICAIITDNKNVSVPLYPLSEYAPYVSGSDFSK